MPKIALGVEYLGTAYNGWQRQSHAPSVQFALEQALSQIASEPIEIYCAGRTDSGVHGIGQVIHFETSAVRPMNAWWLGSNALLPSDIRIRWAKIVSEEFHARFSAKARRYQYWIENRPVHSPVWINRMTWIKYPLDAIKMHAAAQYFLGEQDFNALRSCECQSHSSFRNVMHASVRRQGDLLCFDVKANAFLHHMVRNMIGVLLEVGQNRKPVDWVGTVLHSKDRTQAGVTAKPDGLYLLQVDYPSQYEIPETRAQVF